MSDLTSSTYPVTIAFDPPERIARWRPLVHWLLAIPHFIVLYILNIVATVCVVIAWFAGVITGKVPQGLLEVITMVSRYSVRVSMFLLFLTDQYPPFKFDSNLADAGDYPSVRFDVAAETTGRSRLTIFFRLLLLIPQIIVLLVLGIVTYVVMIIGWFAVIILGRWPEGLRSFLLGVLRWNARTGAYSNLLTDKYPPFSLE